MTLMRLKGLSHDSASHRAMVVLADLMEQLQLAFFVPMNEADRLARTLGLAPCRCVPVLELVENFLAEFETRLLGVVLDGDPGGISSTLRLARGDREFSLPCHPGDALALASRNEAPIYATEDALRFAHPAPASFAVDETSAWLKTVKPEDLQSETF